eukprot:GILI01035180.1.p1 GENE.GILI01035180.1~~GILI01035180.1.p1  ORF type:complete len:278 (-),score=29.07 GILI01035180.1:71-904(-)
MLRTSHLHLANYYRTVQAAPINKVRERWLPPRRPHRGTSIANKTRAEDIKNTEDTRRGVDWYNRIRGRKEYLHWPFIKMTDDPIRRHQDPDRMPSRAFSLLDTQCNSGVPLWNYYEETGRDYQISMDAPTPYLAKFIALYTAKVWSESEIEQYLSKLVSSDAQFATIGGIVANSEALAEHNDNIGCLPAGLLAHVMMCARDIETYNTRKAYRHKMQRSGVLRTNDMERYFALPYLTIGGQAASVPVAHKQPFGVYPEGEYLTTRAVKRYNHPIQRLR